MKLVLQLGDADLDVDVEAATGASVGDLAAALAGGPAPAGTGLLTGHRFLPLTMPLAAAWLRQGSAVRLGAELPEPEVTASPVAELHVTGGLAAGARHSLPAGTFVIGREADVAVDGATVSARHALLRVAAGACTIEDLGSRNGTLVEGRFITAREPLAFGSLVQFGAVQARLVQPAPAAGASVGPPAAGTGTVPFNRPPRHRPVDPPAPVPVPAAPPDPAPPSRFSWALLIAPLVIGVVMAVVFDPMLAAFAIFSPVMAVGTWWEDRRRVARERRRNMAAAAEGLAAFRSALEVATAAEAVRRLEVLADPAECLRRAEKPSTRLWERRRSAPDAFRLLLGTGDLAWSPPLDESAGRPLPEAAAAIDAASSLSRSPVEVDLGPGRVLGLVGPRPAVAAVLRSLVSQAAVHHGPADLQVAVLADDTTAPDWDWVKWLPHCVGWAVGREAAEALAGGFGAGALLLAVVDGEGFTEGRVAPVRELLGRESVAAVVVASSVDRLPASCTTVVELHGPDGLATVTEPALASTVPGVLLAGMEEREARRVARALAALDDPEAGDGRSSLPATVPLLGLLGLGAPTGPALAARWRSARPSSLAAVVGACADGPLVLDLVADGPHALVAGTTGAGKSELLRTWVAGLAATFGPDRLTLVLVDYKGGSAFAECARLPHVVGMVTDLDEQLGERALRSLEAEVRFREAVLARAGCADLDEHALRAGSDAGAGQPLPRLLVVVDEFATMKAELGDFVDSLVGIAQRGRSLGVHLVLATQRPSGAVSDNIRANTNLRVALRVQDGPDSTDVLGTPQAAGLSRHQPGRAFARLGHAEVVGFQAALVSAASPPETSAPVRVHPFAFPSPEAARVISEGPSDLARLVDAAVAAAGALGAPAPRRPWLDPLPLAFDLAALPPGALGLADEPDAQRQVPYEWQPAAGNLLLFGVAGSGTTSALASVALATVGGGRHVHLFVLDFGNGALTPLLDLPEVGAVIGAAERERQERLVRMLRGELERRRAGGLASPAIVLIVDNLGGLCAAFDDVAGMAVRDDLQRLLADGPSLGIVTVGSADRPGAVPLAWFSVVQEKLVFRLADPFDDTVFGLPAAGARRPPGRVIDASTRREVQIALPAPGGLAGLAGAVAEAATVPRRPATLPTPIAVLPERVELSEVAGAADLDGPEWFVPVGIGDHALKPVGLHLGEGDHALIAGPARCGRSTVLCTVAAVVAGARPDVGLWAVVPRRSPLRSVPGLRGLVADAGDIPAVLQSMLGEPGHQVLLVDDADTLDDPSGAFAALFAARRPDLHVVAAGRADILRSAYGHWLTAVRRCRQGLALRPHLDLDGDLWHTVLPRRGPARFGAGRGYLVWEGQIELVQAALPAPAFAGAAGTPAAHDPREARR